MIPIMSHPTTLQLTNQPRKIKATLKLKAPHGHAFYTQEQVFIQWCMYVTKHLPFMPFEMWALIFKKVLTCKFLNPLAKLGDDASAKVIQNYYSRKCRLDRGGSFPCREYILSKGTFRAYYVKDHQNICPYLYMDKKHNVKQCQWSKLGKNIPRYKLPRFVLNYKIG